MDAAHLSQTFYLVCAELGLGAFFTAAVNGCNVERRLGIDGFSEGALAICGCGHPDSGRSSSEPKLAPHDPRAAAGRDSRGLSTSAFPATRRAGSPATGTFPGTELSADPVEWTLLRAEMACSAATWTFLATRLASSFELSAISSADLGSGSNGASLRAEKSTLVRT